MQKIMHHKPLQEKKKVAVQRTAQAGMEAEEEVILPADQIIENKDNIHKLVKLLNHPWRLIKEGGKLGVNGIRRYFTVLILFAVSNTLLFFYAVGHIIGSDFEFSKLPYVLLVLITGLGMTIYASYRTYQYVVIDTMRVIYNGLSSFFRKIADSVVLKFESQLKTRNDLSDHQLSKALDFGKMVNSKYQKLPRVIKKGVLIILNRIPFMGMLMDIKADIVSGNTQEASSKLYNRMDAYISTSIFGNNNTRWVWWLLSLNVLISIAIIKLRIG